MSSNQTSGIQGSGLRSEEIRTCNCDPQHSVAGGPHPECPDDAWECETCGGAIFDEGIAEEIADHIAEATAEARAS
jgi:hypothetical protein